MKVQVTFTVDVDSCEGRPLPENRLVEQAVAQAVANAIGYAEGEGHVHELSGEISILMDGGIVARVV